MTSLGKLLVLTTAIVFANGSAMAQGRGKGVGGGASVSGNLGGQSGINGNFGGQSSANASPKSLGNSNGPSALDRDFGRDRAEDRSPANNSENSSGSNASALGGLNASRSTDTAKSNASSNSRVGEVATYENQMNAALAIKDPTRRNAAITSARQQLAQSSNKPLTSSAIASLDSQLNIKGVSPELGASK